MKRGNILLAAGVLVLAAAALYLVRKPDGSTLSGELKNFWVEDTASITRLFLADKGGVSVKLDRTTRGWTVNDQYPARQDAVNNLLKTICDQRIKATVSKSSYETIVKRIATNSVKTEIYFDGAETPGKVFYVGGSNQDHTGSYMLMEGSTRPFLLHLESFHGWLTPRYFTNPNDWRDRAVFVYDFGEIKSVEVRYPKAPANSFRIEDTGDHRTFRLFALNENGATEEIATFDTVRVRQYLTRYKKIYFESFEETKTGTFQDTILASIPETIYAVEGFLHGKQAIETYLKPLPDGENLEGEAIEFDQDRMYGWLNEADFVVIQYYVFDKLAWQLRDFTPVQPVDKS